MCPYDPMCLLWLFFSNWDTAQMTIRFAFWLFLIKFASQITNSLSEPKTAKSNYDN